MPREEPTTNAARADTARADAVRMRKPPNRGPLLAVAPGVFCLQLSIVNVVLVGRVGAGDRGWVLIDTGLFGSAGAIRRAAQDLFGRDARPAAILLTHGHPDHAGSARTLSETWDAPVFAHALELPYLNGTSAYPPADPTVGGGLLAQLATLYPNRAVDLQPRIRMLPGDGRVPHLPDWRYVPTPGHAPGHVSFFRPDEGVLIAGDAIATTSTESAVSMMTQRRELHGPPACYTIDWGAAGDSVRRLAELRPRFVVAGHGRPMAGDELVEGLDRLAADFERTAVPQQGRYVAEPAVTDERGIVRLPPPVRSRKGLVLAGLGAATVLGLLLRRRGSRSGRGIDSEN